VIRYAPPMPRIIGPATWIGGALACALALVACGGDDGAGPTDAAAIDGQPDATIDAPVDAAADAAVACTTPDDCPWIEDTLRDVVGKLSGQRPIVAGGPLLTRRASVTQRATTREYLRDQLLAWGLPATLQTYGNGTNVVVVLPSTSGASGPIVVVGGHYDGVAASPAAADDGTGTAVAMVAARYLGGLTRRDLPIHVVLFDQEEIGLVGSTAYANMLFAATTPVDSVHVFDMISFDGDGDNALELWSATPAIVATYQLHAEPRGIPLRQVAFDLSDHQSFLERGFATVGASEEFVSGDHTPHYHRATDTYDKVDFAYLTRMTRLALAVVEDRAVGP